MTNTKERRNRKTGAGGKRTMLATRDLPDLVKSILSNTLKQTQHCLLKGGEELNKQTTLSL
jgi:hypothetical protein